MAPIANITIKKNINGNKNHSHFIPTPIKWIEDFTTENKYIRQIIEHNKASGRSSYKIYIELPSNLKLDFVKKETAQYDELDDKISDLANSSEPEKEEKKKALIEEHRKNIKFPLVSTFYFKILYLPGGLDTNTTYTTRQKYLVPVFKHKIHAQIVIDPPTIPNLMINYKKLWADIKELNDLK